MEVSAIMYKKAELAAAQKKYNKFLIAMLSINTHTII
jgi:hypothetical protein